MGLFCFTADGLYVFFCGRFPSGRAFRYIFFAKKKAKKDAAAIANAESDLRTRSVRYENIKFVYTEYPQKKQTCAIFHVFGMH